MKILAYPLALVGLLLVAAPAVPQSKNIHESIDPYSGLRTLFLEVATRGCTDDAPLRDHDPDVHVLLSAVENRDHSVSYFMTPELDGGNALGVRAKGTMDALIDGSADSFTTPMGSTVVMNYAGGRSYLHETVPFAVSQADLARLSNSESLQFRVNGPRQSVQRCTDAKHMRDLPEFLATASQYGAGPGIAQSAAPQAPQEDGDAVSISSSEVKTLSVAAIDTYACAGDPAPGPHDPNVHLIITAEQRPDHTVKYFIVTDLKNGAPLNLGNKGTLVTQINGVSRSFHTPHGSVIEPDGAALHETIAFHVDRRDIVALSKSPIFQFRIDAAGESVQRCTDAKHLRRLTDFVNTTATLYDHPVSDGRHS